MASYVRHQLAALIMQNGAKSPSARSKDARSFNSARPARLTRVFSWHTEKAAAVGPMTHPALWLSVLAAISVLWSVSAALAQPSVGATATSAASSAASSAETASTESASTQPPPLGRQMESPLLQNPYTVAEFGPGLLALPTSDFLLTQSDTRTTGEAVPSVWIWMMYRVTKYFAVGAGTTLAVPFSKSITERSLDLERSHRRQYLTIDAVARYYGLRLPGITGWGGVTLGGAVISDQFHTESGTTEAVILGPSGVVVRTEALSAGVAAGFGWTITQNWSLEASLRIARWFLPNKRACGTTGDCATLSGDVVVFNLGVGVGYRVSL